MYRIDNIDNMIRRVAPGTPINVLTKMVNDFFNLQMTLDDMKEACSRLGIKISELGVCLGNPHRAYSIEIIFPQIDGERTIGVATREAAFKLYLELDKLFFSDRNETANIKAPFV